MATYECESYLRASEEQADSIGGDDTAFGSDELKKRAGSTPPQDISIEGQKAVSNCSKAVFKQQNSCSNHEIHVPFEHGFLADVIRQCDVTLHRHKVTDVEEAPRFSVF